MQDNGPLLRLLFGPKPSAGSDRGVQGIGLGRPPESPSSGPSPEIVAALGYSLSPSRSLERAVRELGLPAVVQQLADTHGRQTMMDLLKKEGRPPHEAARYVGRHAVALVCERYGCRNDHETAAHLRGLV
jgi:hypothetical protein